MNRPKVASLVSELRSSNASFVVNLIRIESGFMAQQQVVKAREYIKHAERLLEDIERGLNAGAPSSGRSGYGGQEVHGTEPLK